MEQEDSIIRKPPSKTMVKMYIDHDSIHGTQWLVLETISGPVCMRHFANRILIRYKELYDIVIQKMLDKENYGSVMLFTGVPGIGKSMFLIYLLYILSKHDSMTDESFALEFKPGKYTFVTSSPCQDTHDTHDTQDIHKDHYFTFSEPLSEEYVNEDTIVLADIKTSNDEPARFAKFLLIFSVPDEKRYKHKMKAYRSMTYIMPTWCEQELRLLYNDRSRSESSISSSSSSIISNICYSSSSGSSSSSISTTTNNNSNINNSNNINNNDNDNDNSKDRVSNDSGNDNAGNNDIDNDGYSDCNGHSNSHNNSDNDEHSEWEWYARYLKIGGIPPLVFEKEEHFMRKLLKLFHDKRHKIAQAFLRNDLSYIDYDDNNDDNDDMNNYLIIHINPPLASQEKEEEDDDDTIEDDYTWDYNGYWVYTLASQYMYNEIALLCSNK